jgi:benzylsuccinate CoA-transferase BbsE subunit/naphthyl-2-methylsuccinate CoA transferase subunit
MEGELNNRSLSDVKVLDFTGELGPYASKLYAGLGAEVIHLEPITGDPLRKKGPFYKGEEDNIEASLQFLYYNGNKKSLVVDLHRPEGQEIFLKLIEKVDIFMESCIPGYLDSLGLSYDRLKEINPKLVQTSITPYGSVGPYKDYPGSDLTCSAMGGFLYLAGIDNDKPVRACDNQAYRMAESYAAVGSSIALLYAQRTGKGQFVDVSAMESVGMALENSAQYWDLEGSIRRGRGKEAGSATVHPCKDGYIAIVAIMGKNKIMWDPFIKWMRDENVEECEVFEDPRWIEPSYRRSDEGYATFCRIFHRYTMQHDKMSLYEKGQANRIALSPVSNGKDLLENPQLKHRNFWQTIEHENLDGGKITFPGSPYAFGDLDWRFGFPAPGFGEHTAQILESLSYTGDDIAALSKEGIVNV